MAKPQEFVGVQALIICTVFVTGTGCTVIPCHNATGLYSGLTITQKNQQLTLLPSPGSSYARFGRGTGNVSANGQDVSVEFEVSPNLTWSGQFVGGCAALFISGGRHGPSMQLLRDDSGPQNWTGPATPPPDWVKDLVIYEIAPRGFTSPNGVGPDGMGTGTFASLQAQVPYLRQLGVTAVWLAGYCNANAHFFSIWSVYATERPDSIDPALGEENDLKQLVSALHAAGIKVFLDVVTHGVTFLAGEQENRSILTSNPFLASHPDYFFHETYNPVGKASGKWLMADYNYASSTFQRWWQTTWLTYISDFDVDGFRLDGPNGISFPSEVMAAWDNITRMAARAGKQIAVFGEMERYHFSEHDIAPTTTDLAANFRQPNDNCFQSVMLSCHDGGFDQPPGNYYGVKGSRARLGYSAIFSWHIPVLFSGDEADLTPEYLPALKQGCYSGGAPGGWLYGSQINWTQFSEPRQAAMHRDTTRMLAIRKSESDVIHANACIAHVARVPAQLANASSSSALWIPYARYLPGKKAIVVAANPSNSSAVQLTMNISVTDMGFDKTAQFDVVDLFNTSAPATRVFAAELSTFSVLVPRDGIELGGLKVLKVTPASTGTP